MRHLTLAIFCAAGVGGMTLSGSSHARPRASTVFASAAPATSDPGLITVTVTRVGGGLGIEVDQDNMVATNMAQQELQVGDLIVAVDGEALEGRPIAQVLQPSESYTFTISRSGSQSIDGLLNLLKTLIADYRALAPSDVAPTGFVMAGEDPEKAAAEMEALNGRIGSTLEAIEAKAAPTSAEAVRTGLLSFWKLLWTSEPQSVVGGPGLTGWGDAPGCKVLAHWQMFGEADPAAQTVEMIANSDMGSSSIAALKGGFEVIDGGDGGEVKMVEDYSRLEYGGSPQIGSPPVKCEMKLAYLGDEIRVVRTAQGEARVYLRSDGGTVSDEISTLLAAPVGPERAPQNRWDRGPIRSEGPPTDAGAMM